MKRAGFSLLLLLATAGCDDIRSFRGRWRGPVSADPALRKGFHEGDGLELVVNQATRDSLDAGLQLPAATDALRFEPIRSASADTLGELRLQGDPLRTFLGYLAAPAGAGSPPDTLAVISLFAEQRVEVRVIRGPDETYGVFLLGRAPGD